MITQSNGTPKDDARPGRGRPSAPMIDQQHVARDGPEEPGVEPGDPAQHRVVRQPHHRQHARPRATPKIIDRTVTRMVLFQKPSDHRALVHRLEDERPVERLVVDQQVDEHQRPARRCTRDRHPAPGVADRPGLDQAGPRPRRPVRGRRPWRSRVDGEVRDGALLDAPLLERCLVAAVGLDRLAAPRRARRRSRSRPSARRSRTGRPRRCRRASRACRRTASPRTRRRGSRRAWRRPCR